MGRIGSALARKAKGVGWNVIGYDYKRGTHSDIKLVDFEGLIQALDIISIQVPLKDETYHLFHKEVFEKMKNNAVLINTHHAGRL